MSSEEFTLWRAFYALEPWGCEVDNWRMGQVCATVVNAQPRPKGRDGRPPKAMRSTDFYADPYQVERQERIELSPEQRAFLAKRKAEKTKGRR